MTPQELVAKFERRHGEVTNICIAIKKVADEKQIIYGEVYIPNVLDTHNEMMLASDVELMAHRFLARLKNDQIDLNHNNIVVKAVVVESFIAQSHDPLYHEGSWVLGVKIDNADLWADIKSGKYNGFSVETFITKADAVVELTFFSQVFGFTEKADGHEHVFFIQMDDEGAIVGGYTSHDDGHDHVIQFATATKSENDHAHRIALP